MLKIVLIRPGSTDFVEEGRVQGTLDMPLNKHGAEEVARVTNELQQLGITTLYCSECEPAAQTAEALALGLGIKLKKLDGMQNLNHGLWQGMLVEEIKRKQPKVYRQWQDEPERIIPPEGETLADAQKRAKRVVKKLLRKHRDGHIGLVVPEPLASVVRSLLCDCELGDLWQAPSHHGQWEAIAVEQYGAATSG